MQIPDTSFKQPKGYYSPNLKYKLKQLDKTKGVYKVKEWEELIYIWGEMKWELDEDKHGVYIANLGEIKNSKYYDDYYSPFMEIMRDDKVTMSILANTQSRNTTYSSAAPVPLVAAKRYHDIPFSAFAHNDIRNASAYNFIVSNFEKAILEAPYEWQRLLSNIRANDSTTQDIFSLYTTGYNMRHIPENWVNEETGESRFPGFEELPKILKHMALQTWIFNPNNRDGEYMILDPFDWDVIPEAYNYHRTSEAEHEIPWRKGAIAL